MLSMVALLPPALAGSLAPGALALFHLASFPMTLGGGRGPRHPKKTSVGSRRGSPLSGADGQGAPEIGLSPEAGADRTQVDESALEIALTPEVGADRPPVSGSAPMGGGARVDGVALTVRSAGAGFSAFPSREDSEEAELVASLRAGDDAAYERLVRLHGGRMLAIAQRFFGHGEDALDAVQDAFISAFRAIGRFEGHAKLSTWLHQITVNAALMKLRTQRRRPEDPIEDLLPAWMEDGHYVTPPSEWNEPGDAAFEREETRVFVRKCIEELPERYRTVLLLRDIEELDTEETARLLGITENAVKTRLHRARQALRSLLDSRFGRAL